MSYCLAISNTSQRERSIMCYGLPAATFFTSSYFFTSPEEVFELKTSSIPFLQNCCLTRCLIQHFVSILATLSRSLTLSKIFLLFHLLLSLSHLFLLLITKLFPRFHSSDTRSRPETLIVSPSTDTP